MALTYTPDPAIGQPCPDFELVGVDGKIHTLKDFNSARALLVMFICNHCPYVIAVQDRLIALANHFANLSVKIVAISSNDAGRYPADSLENMTKLASEKGFPFPYLFDESQAVAHAFGAVCTPDFFLYDGDRKLVYRGRLDDSWKDPAQVKSQDLKAAISAVLTSDWIDDEQVPSMGCSIKWKEKV